MSLVSIMREGKLVGMGGGVGGKGYEIENVPEPFFSD